MANQIVTFTFVINIQYILLYLKKADEYTLEKLCVFAVTYALA